MEDIGFTPKTAVVLASEMKEVGLEPNKAAREIVKLVKKHGSLELAVSKLHKKEEQFKRQASTIQNEIDTLKKHRDGIQESINNREKSIENLESWYNKRKKDLEQEYYEKNNNLEKEHAEKRKKLDTGYDLRKRSLNLEISTLSEERDELQRNFDLLTETKMQHCEAFEFVAYTLHFLADREKVPTKIFENLIWRLNSIVERRRKGFITDWEEKKARSTILKGLMDYTDVVLKSEYDKIKEENDILTSPDPDRARLNKQMRRIIGDMLPP